MRKDTTQFLSQLGLLQYSGEYILLGGAIDVAYDMYARFEPIIVRDICSELAQNGYGVSGSAVDRRLRRALERLGYGHDTRAALDNVLGRSDYETVPLQEFLYAAVRQIVRNSLDNEDTE